MNTLPPLSQSDYTQLKNSIAQDGQRVPILRDSNTGEIVDGEHRLQVCQELGLEPLIEDRALDVKESTRLKLILNLARRHLTVEQKKELVKELRSQGFTQQESADIVGVTDRTVRNIEKRGEVTGNFPVLPPPDLRYKLTSKHQEEIVERIESGETQKRVAADYGISRRRVGQIKKKFEQKYEKKRKRQEMAEDGANVTLPNEVQVLTGDFRELCRDLPDNSIDLVFTDPPYDKESIPLYGDLAKAATRVLKPGGSLICYVGHYAVPDVLPLMTPHLRFWWLLCISHSGNSARLPGKWVFVEWKPALWFVKESRYDNRYVADKFQSSQPDKEAQDWQQDISEAKYYIERLTDEANVVLDPFCGSGTTLVAALSLNRRAIGIEIDPGRADITRSRIDKWLLHRT